MSITRTLLFILVLQQFDSGSAGEPAFLTERQSKTLSSSVEKHCESRADGARRLNIPLSGSLQNPAFSPDGKSVVFTRFRKGYNKGPSDLYIYHLKTGRLKPLVTDGSSNVNLPGSSWHPTLGAIVFSSTRDEHDEIYSISDNGQRGDETPLTHRKHLQAYEPSWSPDGKWVVFESHLIDQPEGVITKCRVESSAKIRGRSEKYVDLTDVSEDGRQPNWSPSGNRILYQKKDIESEEWSLWTMNPDGSDKNRITKPGTSCTDAVFSLDGRWILYSGEGDSIKLANLFVIPRAGGTPVQVTRFDGYDGAASVSSDGSMIVFESSRSDPDGSPGTRLWILQDSKRLDCFQR